MRAKYPIAYLHRFYSLLVSRSCDSRPIGTACMGTGVPLLISKYRRSTSVNGPYGIVQKNRNAPYFSLHCVSLSLLFFQSERWPLGEFQRSECRRFTCCTDSRFTLRLQNAESKCQSALMLCSNKTEESVRPK